MQKLEPAKLSCHTVGWRYSHSPRRKLPNLDSSWSWDSYAWNKPLFEWYIHPIIAPPSQLMSIWSETVSRKGGKDKATASSQSRPVYLIFFGDLQRLITAWRTTKHGKTGCTETRLLRTQSLLIGKSVLSNMASTHYRHIGRFLNRLRLCRGYNTNLAVSIVLNLPGKIKRIF